YIRPNSIEGLSAWRLKFIMASGFGLYSTFALMPNRVNVGCGQSPTPGWINFDNSLTVRLAPIFARLPNGRGQFARVARQRGIRYATATHIPLPSASVEVLYSSHMMEH